MKNTKKSLVIFLVFVLILMVYISTNPETTKQTKEHTHEFLDYGRKEYDFQQYNGENHAMSVTTPELCECGYVVDYQINHVLRPHYFNDENTCTECGYVEGDHTNVKSRTGE